MHPIQDQPLPISPIQTAKYAKPLVIAGSIAIVASLISAVAIIVFATPLMPILLPIAATVGVAGVVCLCVGLRALGMNEKKEPDLKAPVENKDVKEPAEGHDGNLKEASFEDTANAYLEKNNEHIIYLLHMRKKDVKPEEKMALCRQLIERHREKAKIVTIDKVLNILDIEPEQRKVLRLELCHYYIQQKRFEDAYDIAYADELVGALQLIFNEFLETKNLEKWDRLELLCKMPKVDAKVKNSWRCRLAYAYANIGYPTVAKNLVAPLSWEQTKINPETKLYELLQIRFYGYSPDENTLKNLAYSLSGYYNQEDNQAQQNHHGFNEFLKLNLTEEFRQFCEKKQLEQAHQELVRLLEEFKK